MFNTVEDLRASLMDPLGGLTAEYRAKQCHEVPEFPTVKRAEAILLLAAGETVLDVGGTGPLHEALQSKAKAVYTWDRGPVTGPGCQIDLDAVGLDLPVYDDVTLVICGEVLEHLANPGHFLDRLKVAYPVPKVFTVPNAHSESGTTWLRRGIENVNDDHVAWYSWKTLQTLLDRSGYTVSSWSWYNGAPKFAEGLMVVTD